MRFQRILLVLGLAVLFGVGIMVVGCSNDDEAPAYIVGPMDDPEFMVVQDQIEIFVDSTVQALENGLNSIINVTSEYDDQIDPIYYGPVKPDSDYVNAVYANGWHVAEVSRVRAGYTFTLRDSIQFYNGNAIQQGPNNIDSLAYRHRWSYMNHDTTASHTDLEAANSFTFQNLNSGMAQTSGMHQLMIQNKFVSADSTVWREYTFEANLQNVSINETGSGWVQGCPNSGYINASLTSSYQKDQNDPVTATWNVSITFTDGIMTASVYQANKVWSYSASVCNAINY